MNKGNYSFRLTYSEEDECYLATIPEFKGVVGHGDTRQEALQEAEVSLRAALEVYEAKAWPLPEPEQHYEYSGQFRLRVPRSLHAKLATQAAQEGVSLNTYSISLLSQNSEGAKQLTDFQNELRSMVNEIEKGRRAANLFLANTQFISGVYQSPESTRYVGSSASGTYAENVTFLNTNPQAKEAKHAKA